MIECDFCFSGPLRWTASKLVMAPKEGPTLLLLILIKSEATQTSPGAHFGAPGAAFGRPNGIVFRLRPIDLRGAGSRGLRRLALDALGVHHAMSHELLRYVVDAPGGTNRHY